MSCLTVIGASHTTQQLLLCQTLYISLRNISHPLQIDLRAPEEIKQFGEPDILKQAGVWAYPRDNTGLFTPPSVRPSHKTRAPSTRICLSSSLPLQLAAPCCDCQH